MKTKKLIALLITASMCVVMAGCSASIKTTTGTSNSAAETATENQEELVPYETGGEEFTDEDEISTDLCLTGGEYLYKDYTFETNEYNPDDGSYYDKYISEDGVQAIYEKGVKDYNTDIAIEDYMLEEATKLAGDSGVMNATIKEATFETELSYPDYIAKFYSGNNEDTRSWIVYVVDTDCGLYMYGLSCAAEYEDDMFRDADEVFPHLMIEENYRGLDAGEAPEVIDLMDFFGKNVEDACAAIAGLEKDGEQYSSKDEKAFDGVAIAGPFIDVDANGNVTGITYSGTTYSVETLWVGTSVEYSGEFLKDRGWEFQDVDFAHGTAQYVVTYTKDNMQIVLISDESGDFNKSEESDVTGCIATITVSNK